MFYQHFPQWMAHHQQDEGFASFSLMDEITDFPAFFPRCNETSKSLCDIFPTFTQWMKHQNYHVGFANCFPNG